jgi:hypothetical protein
MKIFFPILLLFALFSWANGADSAPCLPKDVSNDTLISAGTSARDIVTVRETLARIGARCQEGKLVDAAGREVRFIHLIGCWGNPPLDYQEQLSRQATEIERLKTRYTVFEVPCATTNPRAVQ